MESAVHRLASPIADPAKQLPVISKARAPPPGRLGRLPRRPMIPPAGSAHSAHSDPFPMAAVPKRLQGPKPYNPKETQSDLGEYGESSIPYLAEPLWGPRQHASAQSEVQRLEELERYQHSEGGQVVEAAEHENFHVETKEVILRSAITALEALVHGGAGEHLRQDPLVQNLLNHGKARGSSEAAPTATPVADAPRQHQDPASRSSEPAGGRINAPARACQRRPGACRRRLRWRERGGSNGDSCGRCINGESTSASAGSYIRIWGLPSQRGLD